ncbi:MAG: aldehyde dehydrogenase family protein [Deltaproteobacteria bacterium]|nr:aldehyde dehydrogenase family protein [Deltaproteobacteria bacterium]
MEDNIQEMYQRARKAFEIVEFWPQEKVDEMCQAAAWEWQKEENRKLLARLSVDESGIGRYEDKVNKIKDKCLGTLWDQRDVKTCGVIEDIPEKNLKILAKPIGVIANVVPCTNPESTICALGLSMLKTRNAMIVSPHPRTPKSSYMTVELGRKALKKIGAPEDLMQCIEHPTNEKTQKLMASCDYAVATGGAALIKVVYEAGKPAQTVGAGNVISIVDATADLKAAANKIMMSKCANNSASCSSENAVAIEESVFDEMMGYLKAEGGYLCTTEERERLRKWMWPDGTVLNRDCVARPVDYPAKMAEIDIPDGTRCLMVMGEKIGREDRFSGEKISLVLTIWKWNDFSDMVERAKQMHKFSGEGHSVAIHSTNQDRMMELAIKANVGRVCCNMPHGAANSGAWFSGNPFTDTLGCGTWAGNISSTNVNWKHFLNYTNLAQPIENYHVPTEEELLGPYLKKWGRD